MTTQERSAHGPLVVDAGGRRRVLRRRRRFEGAKHRAQDNNVNVLGQAGFVAGGRLCGALLQAASLAVLARQIGPPEFGEFAVWYGAAVVLQAVLNFGLTPLLVRMRAAGDREPDVAAILRFCRRGSVLAGLVGLLACLTLVAAAGLPAYVVLLAGWVVVDNLVETYLAIPLADGRAWENASSLIFRRAILFAVLISGVSLGLDPSAFYGVGLLLGSLASLLLVARSLKRGPQTAASAMGVRSIAAEAKYFWTNSVVTQARNLDVVVVSLVATGGATVGYFAAASRLTSPLRIVPTSFAAVLMPAAVRALRSGQYKSAVRATVAVCAVSSLGFLCVGLAVPYVLPRLLGGDYEGAVGVVQIVCLGLVFAAIASQLNAVLQAFGHVRLVSNISLSTTVTCLVLVAVLVPPFGAAGGGWGLTASYVLQSVVLVLFTWRSIRRGS